MNSPRPAQRGAVSVMVALALVTFVGLAAIGLDLGRLFIVKSELQNVADSCALAAAGELDGASDALTRAQQVANTVLARHHIVFQREAIDAGSLSLTFSTGPGAPYLSAGAGATPATATLARCTLSKQGLDVWFGRVIGITAEGVTASSGATLAPTSANCVIPIGVCAQGGAPDWGLTPGQWLDFPPFGTSKWRWVDFSPPAGGTSELNAWLTGPGACGIPVGRLVGQPGEHNGVSTGWNSRFGIYSKGKDAPGDVLSAPPDRTGKAYVPGVSTPALPDFLAARVANTPYSDSQTGYNLTKSKSVTSLYGTYGGNRRLAVAPIVDCVQLDGHTAPIVDFACVLLLNPMDNNNTLYLEYQGLARSAPCIVSGMPGGPSAAGGRTPTLTD